MGRSTHVRIMNTSDVNLEVSYEDVSCMFRGGQEGSDFDPISGQVASKYSLPFNKDDQYIEKEANGTCAFKDGYFTMKLTEVSTRKDLARLKFQADKSGYYCKSKEVVDNRLKVEPSIGSDAISVAISNSNLSGKTWMTDIASYIGDFKLNELVIPGTHDSGTYGVSATSTIAPNQDIPEWVNAVYALGLSGLLVMEVIAKWAKTQGYTIAQQLDHGIRYFDLRVVRSGGGGL